MVFFKTQEMFDKKAIENYEKKIVKSAWLDERIADITFENLSDLTNIKAEEILNISTKSDYLSKKLQEKYQNLMVYNDYKIFDGTLDLEGKFDVIFSLSNLHKINNIRKYLLQIKNLMNKNGIFFSSMLGGENCYSLCDSMFLAHEQGGLGFINHFLPVVDIKDLGSLLQSCGFQNIVLAREDFKKKYDSINDAFLDIKNHGERNCMINRIKTPITREILKTANEIFLQKHSGIVEYKILTIFAQ